MLWRRKGMKFGRRLLKLGVYGADVAQLQKCLTEFGYQVGPIDGQFGYLTQEALRIFQRDFRLRIDGIAGAEVFKLLKESKLPIKRGVHLVQPGETINQISQLYNLSPAAFGHHEKKTPIYPGQTLVFFHREVWGIPLMNIAGQDSFQVNQASLTGIFYPSTLCQEVFVSEPFRQGVKIVATNLGTGESKVDMHNLLTNRKQRKSSFGYFKKALAISNGVYLPWENFSRVDGARYYKYLRKLKKIAGNKRLMIGLTSATPKWNIFGGLDFKEVSSLVDQIVVRFPLPSQPRSIIDKGLLESFIHELLHYIPSYKVLLRIPVYALKWTLAESECTVETLSHSAAMSQIFRYGARMDTDQEDSIYYRYHRQGVDHEIRVTSLRTYHQVLNLINRYNLAGIVIDGLGMEDQRLWQTIRSHFMTEKFL